MARRDMRMEGRDVCELTAVHEVQVRYVVQQPSIESALSGAEPETV